MIARLQYLTQATSQIPHWQFAEWACQAGVKWIQLRVKDKAGDEWLDIARKTRRVCREYGAVFVVNDNVQLAKMLNADGVHLGRNDLHPARARAILGGDCIIGGTANTFDDIVRLQDRVDYIGLGPFRFTATKANLSPILGLAGYREVIRRRNQANIDLPVIAVGGIQAGDLTGLLECGVDGVAVSSAITFAEDIPQSVRDFQQYIEKNRW